MATAPTTADDQLDWEARHRVGAAIAAAVAAVLSIVGGIYSQQAYRDFPYVGPLQALNPALHGQVDAKVNPGTAGIEFLDSHAASLIASRVISALGLLLTGYVAWFLFRAAKARRPEMPEVARWLTVAGAIGMAVILIALQVGACLNAHDFVAGADRSRDAVKAVQGGGVMMVLTIVGVVAQFAFAFGVVLVSLNAMRTGLLTRFMGVLGIIVGVLVAIPIGAPLPVVQFFWLMALAVLFLHRWPGGMPPAWITGRAESWPSQAEMAQRRQEQRGGGAGRAKPQRGGSDDDAAEPAPAPHPSSARKRRKRRR